MQKERLRTASGAIQSDSAKAKVREIVAFSLGTVRRGWWFSPR